jgi:Putative prokaryotic signal transducing protein
MVQHWRCYNPARLAAKGTMLEILRTNDPVLLSFVEAILADAGVTVLVADRHTSIIEGSIGVFPRRVLVPGDEGVVARRALTDAGLAMHLLAAP